MRPRFPYAYLDFLDAEIASQILGFCLLLPDDKILVRGSGSLFGYYRKDPCFVTHIDLCMITDIGACYGQTYR